MDRTIVYPAAIPQDTDLLSPQRSAMVALGMLGEAVLGGTGIVSGLVVSPTVPAAMTVQISRGMVAGLASVDGTAFGTLPADARTLLKMGTTLDVIIAPIAAPLITGQSQVFLIEASLSETDTLSTVLPYYNAANPLVSYAGPNNTGVPQNTARFQRANVVIKPGIAATTGTQVAPAADAGFLVVALVTVNAGQAAITSTSITVPAAAPVIPYTLPQLGQLFQNFSTQYPNTGRLVNIQTFVASGTYTPTPGARSIIVRAVGGGGAGGGIAPTGAGFAASGGGGGSGAYGFKYLTTIAVTSVGIGGGGVGGSGAGGTGGTTSFGSIFSLAGGSGGSSGAGSNVAFVSANTGAGGTQPAGMTFGIVGENGSAGMVLSSTSAISGAGANGPYGAGGTSNGVNNTAASMGAAGSGYGAGGGGGTAVASGIATPGGSGAQGIVIIEEYS